ncbi:PH and SEC7 domain-containing protein C11E3.11c [Schizosaccharomyces pombe]
MSRNASNAYLKNGNSTPSNDKRSPSSLSQRSKTSTRSSKPFLQRLFPSTWFKNESSSRHPLTSIKENDTQTIGRRPSMRVKLFGKDKSKASMSTNDLPSHPRSQSVMGFSSSTSQLTGTSNSSRTRLNKDMRRDFGMTSMSSITSSTPTPSQLPVRPSTSLSFFDDIPLGPSFSAETILSSLSISTSNNAMSKTTPAPPLVTTKSISADQDDFYTCKEEVSTYEGLNSQIELSPVKSRDSQNKSAKNLSTAYRTVSGESRNLMVDPKVSPYGNSRTPLRDSSNYLRDRRSINRQSSLSIPKSTSETTRKTLALSNGGIDQSRVSSDSFKVDDSSAKMAAIDIWEGSQHIVSNDKALSWLVTDKPYNKAVLKHYISLYDFENTDILQSLRMICGNLYVHGETQELDHFLGEFSNQWCRTNPKGLFCNPQIVHSIAFSLLLLNTDLHIAELSASERMSRNQFVENTYRSIKQALNDSFDGNEEKKNAFFLSSYKSFASNESCNSPAIHSLHGNLSPGKSAELKKLHKRSLSSKVLEEAFSSYWMSALKEMYHSIKVSMILQPDRYLDMNFDFNDTNKINNPSSTANQTRHFHSVSEIKKLPMGTDELEKSMVRPSTAMYINRQNENAVSIDKSRDLQGTVNTKEIRSRSALSYQNDRPLATDLPSVIYNHKHPNVVSPFYVHPYIKQGILKFQSKESHKFRKKEVWSTVLAVLQRDVFTLYNLNTPNLSYDPKDLDISKVGKPVIKTTIIASLAKPFPSSEDAVVLKSTNSLYFDLETSSQLKLRFAGPSPKDAQGWIDALNYWAARSSKVPLLGGVTNVDYGWARCTGQRAQKSNAQLLKTKTDKIIVRKWQPQPVNTIPSSLSLGEQLSAFNNFMKLLKKTNDEHQNLHKEMLVVLSSQPKSTFRRAVENWKYKSDYLQLNLVRLRVYISVLEKYKSQAQNS